MSNWYDYDKQEMVSLPPVGEIVFARTDRNEIIKVKILEHMRNGLSNIAVCRVINNYNPTLGTLEYHSIFTPLNRECDVLIANVAEIIYDNAQLSKQRVSSILYELGYLKPPEGK